MKFFGDIPFGEEKFRELLAGGVTVKKNPVREVFHAGNYFIKHDGRGGPSLRKEYEKAKFLEKRGIPVVRHLGYIADGKNTYLVTEAVENAVDVATVAENGGIDDAFWRKYVDFIQLLREKRLRHGDLHGGNILFAPDTRKFFLVDTLKVHRSPLIFYRDAIFYHLITDARRYLAREKIFAALRELGASRPEKVWRRNLRKDFRRTMHEWKKRRQQILSGYWRFTRTEGHFVLDRHAQSAEIATSRRFPARIAMLGAYYFLTLNKLPAERIIGYDFSCKELLLPQTRSFESASPESVADFRERLEICGIVTREEDWRRDAAGHTVLINWEKVAEKLW